jgi:hypothetical protein
MILQARPTSGSAPLTKRFWLRVYVIGVDWHTRIIGSR